MIEKEPSNLFDAFRLKFFKFIYFYCEPFENNVFLLNSVVK